MLLKISGVCLVVLGMLFLLPASPSVEGTIRISSVYGPVEHKTLQARLASFHCPRPFCSLTSGIGFEPDQRER